METASQARRTLYYYPLSIILSLLSVPILAIVFPFHSILFIQSAHLFLGIIVFYFVIVYFNYFDFSSPSALISTLIFSSIFLQNLIPINNIFISHYWVLFSSFLCYISYFYYLRLCCLVLLFQSLFYVVSPCFFLRNSSTYNNIGSMMLKHLIVCKFLCSFPYIRQYTVL